MRAKARPKPAPVEAANPTAVECPTCSAWVGWACGGRGYGYHAAGYHPARHEAALALETKRSA